MDNKSKAHNEADMIQGCLNRMLLTEDQEEFTRMYESARLRLINIQALLCNRFNEEE